MADDVWDTILHKYVVPFRHHNAFCPPTFIAHKDGEPLLNKRLPSRLMDLADAAPDMKVDIYSHGLLLPKWRDRGQDFFEFLATLPNRCRYLLSHHPRNHDDSVNDYTAVISYLKEALRRPPPNVEFITVSHKSRWVTEAMQDAWDEALRGLPVTIHRNASINPWTGRIDSDVKFNGCPYADFGHWFFGVTGNVIACCLDLEEEIVLGNVMRDDPRVMFDHTDEFYGIQRRTLEERRRPTHQVCSDCFGYERAHTSPTELVQLGVRAP